MITMNATRSRPPTMGDIAARAAVSTATVSYVLNDTPGNRIPEETRRRVLAAAEDLGYVPHTSARSLRTGRSDLVLFAMPATTLGPLASRFFTGLAEELRALGYTLILHGDPEQRGAKAARAWAGLRPAAVIAEGRRLTPSAVSLLTGAGAVPLALGRAPRKGVPALVLDHFGMGETGGRHLVEQGCTDIAALVPRAPVVKEMGEERLAGLAKAAAGVRVRRTDMDETPEDAARVVAEWAEQGMPDGVYGYNDEFAGLLLGALADAGVDVPGRVRLVGTDDLPLCEMLRPRLTSVGLRPVLSVGEVAAHIAALVSGEADPAESIRAWEPELRRRGSA